MYVCCLVSLVKFPITYIQDGLLIEMLRITHKVTQYNSLEAVIFHVS